MRRREQEGRWASTWKPVRSVEDGRVAPGPGLSEAGHRRADQQHGDDDGPSGATISARPSASVAGLPAAALAIPSRSLTDSTPETTPAQIETGVSLPPSTAASRRSAGAGSPAAKVLGGSAHRRHTDRWGKKVVSYTTMTTRPCPRPAGLGAVSSARAAPPRPRHRSATVAADLLIRWPNPAAEGGTTTEPCLTREFSREAASQERPTD